MTTSAIKANPLEANIPLNAPRVPEVVVDVPAYDPGTQNLTEQQISDITYNQHPELHFIGGAIMVGFAVVACYFLFLKNKTKGK